MSFGGRDYQKFMMMWKKFVQEFVRQCPGVEYVEAMQNPLHATDLYLKIRPEFAFKEQGKVFKLLKN